jgi:HB1, ASXL, restriction endonuclease HTH domain
MPDQYGFDHLGDSVRCIDCQTGGPIWQWPEPKRWRHARTHRTVPDLSTEELRRQRILLAAPPTNHDEEKEATTMATTPKSGKGEPAKQVAIDVLRKADEPLHAKEIAKRLLASGRCTSLNSKTPEATISAMLAFGSKPGGALGESTRAATSRRRADGRNDERGLLYRREANAIDCATKDIQHGATLKHTGAVRLCNHPTGGGRVGSSCTQNWGDKNTPVQQPSQPLNVNGFHSTSETSAITCVVASGAARGKGFRLTSGGLASVHP